MVNATLKNKIDDNYKSDAAFAIKIGWAPQKVSKLIHGEYIPKIGEAVTISRALSITLDELASFF